MNKKQIYDGYYHSSTVYQLAHGLKKVIPTIQCKPLATGNLEVSIPAQNWKHKNVQTQFNNILNVSGYFIAVQETRQHPYTNERLQIMELEARYNEQELSDTVYNEYHGIVYHLAPTIKANKILKYGLSPKSQNKLAYHPERLYFTIVR